MRFLSVLVVGLLAFLIISVVIDFFEKIGDYIDKGVPAQKVALLYVYRLPYITILTLPIAMLLASLFSIGQLSRDNELTAMLTTGLPLPRILLPLFLLAGAISVGAYFFGDRVVTRSSVLLEELKAQEIDKKPRADQSVQRQVHQRSEDGRILWAETYYPSQQRFENLVLLRYEDSRLREYTAARHAYWAGEHWRLLDGFQHLLPDSAGQSRPERDSRAFQRLEMTDWHAAPADFSQQAKEPEAMDYRELKAHILEQTRAGFDADRLWVDLHVKASFPWANLVIVLLGCALSASKRRISLAAGFGLTVAIAFIYLIFLRLGLSLGHNQTLPPLLAAWVANALFLSVGIVLLARASR
jgi:lipopolysaccharide export system permease protein